MNDSSPTLLEAQRLIDLGYAVFPCLPGSKAPATRNGLLDATRDADQIAEWFGSGDYNLAVSTNGLVVVDVDPVDGLPNPWLTPERAYDLTAFSSSTPRGGRHFWFRQPDGMDLRNTTGKIADGVDTRGSGGYAMVPPSVTEHGHYEWLPGAELDCSPSSLPDVPAWIVESLTDKPKSASSATAEPASDIPSGQRNATLASIAGTLRRQGFSQAEIEAALLIRNRNACKPPLDDAEVRKIAWSVSRYEPDQIAVAVAEGWFEQDRQKAAAFQVCDMVDLINRNPELDAPVIEGLLRAGEVCNVIAKSKVGKSWLI